MQTDLNKKLQQAIGKNVIPGFYSTLDTTAAAGACEQIAEEHAIKFAERIAHNCYRDIIWKDGEQYWCDVSEYEWMGEENRLISTQELYQLFTKQLKQ